MRDHVPPSTALSRVDIEQQLEKMLKSAVFSNAERQQRFLKYITTHTLQGHVHKLKGYTIGIEVFDRETDFDPSIDAIVRVEASRLRSRMLEYYATLGQKDLIRFHLPKGSYAVSIERVSLPHSSAAIESHGLHESPLFRQQAAIERAKQLEQITDRPAIAVLPFENFSTDKDQNYFADGITDTLITELSKIREFFVISRHSSFLYRGAQVRAEVIGQELGVRYLLEGSIQKASNSVRINAKLFDSWSGLYLWGEHYDRSLDDIFEIQDDVTRNIAQVLHLTLIKTQSSKQTSNVIAYDFVLKGLEQLWTYKRINTQQSIAYFEQAITLEPEYAAAHVWLARSLTASWIFMWDPRDETLERAHYHVMKGIQLDPHYAHGHAILGWVELWRKKKQNAIAAGRRSVAIDPNNSDGMLFLSLTLTAADEGEEALRLIEQGIRLNPYPSALYYYALGASLMVLKQLKEASAAFREGLLVTEQFLPCHVYLSIVEESLGNIAEAQYYRERAAALAAGLYPILRSIWLSPDHHLTFSDAIRRIGQTKL